MKCTTSEILGELFCRHPALEACRGDVVAAFEVLLAAYRSGGKVLTCGNGGSAADAEHVVGELMKCFRKRRELPESIAAKLRPELAAKLEGALPAISLVSMEGLLTAFANDVAWETAFAQQVLALARPGDGGSDASGRRTVDRLDGSGGIASFRRVRHCHSRAGDGDLSGAGAASARLSRALRHA